MDSKRGQETPGIGEDQNAVSESWNEGEGSWRRQQRRL
jgi:hypothetical protein